MVVERRSHNPSTAYTTRRNATRAVRRGLGRPDIENEREAGVPSYYPTTQEQHWVDFPDHVKNVWKATEYFSSQSTSSLALSRVPILVSLNRTIQDPGGANK